MAKPDRLIYLALGGAGEIGMNMYLYGYGPEGAERFILVDMGVSFPTMESTPGVELIMADPAWIQARADRLEAIFITHGHEDHRRRARPALAPAAGAGLCPPLHRGAGQGQDGARRPADRRGAPGRRPGRTWCMPGRSRVGFLPIAHSIPESSALVIDTPAGRILHSGRLQGRPDAAGRRAVRRRRRCARSATRGVKVLGLRLRPTSSTPTPAAPRRR